MPPPSVPHHTIHTNSILKQEGQEELVSFKDIQIARAGDTSDPPG